MGKIQFNTLLLGLAAAFAAAKPALNNPKPKVGGLISTPYAPSISGGLADVQIPPHAHFEKDVAVSVPKDHPARPPVIADNSPVVIDTAPEMDSKPAAIVSKAPVAAPPADSQDASAPQSADWKSLHDEVHQFLNGGGKVSTKSLIGDLKADKALADVTDVDPHHGFDSIQAATTEVGSTGNWSVSFCNSDQTDCNFLLRSLNPDVKPDRVVRNFFGTLWQFLWTRKMMLPILQAVGGNVEEVKAKVNGSLVKTFMWNTIKFKVKLYDRHTPVTILNAIGVLNEEIEALEKLRDAAIKLYPEYNSNGTLEGPVESLVMSPVELDTYHIVDASAALSVIRQTLDAFGYAAKAGLTTGDKITPEEGLLLFSQMLPYALANMDSKLMDMLASTPKLIMPVSNASYFNSTEMVKLHTMIFGIKLANATGMEYSINVHDGETRFNTSDLGYKSSETATLRKTAKCFSSLYPSMKMPQYFIRNKTDPYITLH